MLSERIKKRVNLSDFRKENSMNEKQCNICGQTKSLDEFYSHLAKPKTKPPYMYYRPDCKECTSRKAREWAVENEGYKREYMKKYREEHLETFLDNARSWREKNKERKNEYQLNYQRENKDKIKSYNETRKDKNHRIKLKEWKACKEHFNHSCAYCGISEEEHKKTVGQYLHKEHVDHEGTNDISNCVPSCRDCNSSKWKFNFFEWYSPDNEVFSEERFFKIIEWLEKDYKRAVS